MKIHELSFSYGKKQVLRDLSLEVAPGEIVAIMGASGCGKSTLLQLTAGLLKPDSGRIESDAKRISYAFQEPRLFPWLTVKENLEAVLPRTLENRENAILRALEAVELADSADLYPDALSGGMKSRAALARALVFGGDLFLLDEPFAALDRELRMRLGDRLKQTIKERGGSAILVTHHPEDAERLADRIITL
ncbi:MAG: ABC transporter ATP-binding protein [Ruminococcaceae bacterium]|nr:ABC transporter ATP-binding protein [Oscillospiraceae bacterium]